MAVVVVVAVAVAVVVVVGVVAVVAVVEARERGVPRAVVSVGVTGGVRVDLVTRARAQDREQGARDIAVDGCAADSST